MKRVKFKLIGVDKKDVIRFLVTRGYSIRFLDIKVDWSFGRSMKYFLHKLDKLNEFSVERADNYDSDDDDFDEQEFNLKPEDSKIADLSNLKIFKFLHINDLKDIINNSINLKNLTKLTAKLNDSDDNNHDILIDFICQQNKLQVINYEDLNDDFEFPNRDISKSIKFNLNQLRLVLTKIHQDNFISFLSTQTSKLQVLELEVTDTAAFNFPLRDISRDVNFNLKILKLSYPNIHKQNFIKFLRNQAACLQELELNYITYYEVFEMILSNFEVLEKLTIDEEGSEALFDDNLQQDLSLESLRYFNDKNQNGTIVKKLLKLFPNIETLKCCDTMQAEGISETLTTLHVSEVYWPRIRNLTIPNLKNLLIKKIDKCDDEYYWTHFTANFLNVENITVEKVGFEDKDVLRFVKKLKVFTKLKTFKLRHGNAIDHDYKLDDNERVEVDNKFYKILIDIPNKKIKLSSFIVRNCRPILKILLITFKGFEFFEFCFFEIKICHISIETKRFRMVDG